MECTGGAKGNRFNECSKERLFNSVLGLLKVDGMTFFLLLLHDIVDLVVHASVSNNTALENL